VDTVTAAVPDVVTVTEDDVRHEIWVCTDGSVSAAMAAELVDSQCMIADGHHRWAALQTLTAASPDLDALVMLVDVDRGGLRLGPIHRVLRDATWAAVDSAGVPSGAGLADKSVATDLLARDPASCVLTDGRRWMVVHGMPPGEPPGIPAVETLAVSRLHAEWVAAWRCAESEIQYVHDADVAQMLVRRDGGLAVLLPTLTLDTVFAAARAGAVLPRKATSFAPKPRIGLLMRRLEQVG
jgi:uncharacterized protein (DUF1015 family)